MARIKTEKNTSRKDVIVSKAAVLFREKGLIAEEFIGSPENLVYEVLNIATPQALQQWLRIFLENCQNKLRQPI